MEKFLKSIFNTTDRKKASHDGEGEDEKTETPPMDGRRQLSISRSGRMKQANKKRNSLTLELYGDILDIDPVKKHVPIQYHVHGPVSQTAPAVLVSSNRVEDDPDIEIIDPHSDLEVQNTYNASLEKKLNTLALESGSRSPEEEIDDAFEIIDKS